MGNRNVYHKCCGKESTTGVIDVLNDEIRYQTMKEELESKPVKHKITELESKNEQESDTKSEDKDNVIDVKNLSFDQLIEFDGIRYPSVSTLDNMNYSDSQLIDHDIASHKRDDAVNSVLGLYMAGLAGFDIQNVHESYKPELVNDTLSKMRDLSRIREIATFLIFGYCRELNESDQPYYDIVFTISSYYDFDAEEFLEIHSNLFFPRALNSKGNDSVEMRLDVLRTINPDGNDLMEMKFDESFVLGENLK